MVPFGANTNLSPTRRSGFELFGEAGVSPRLELSGSLVLQSAKFRSGVYGGIDVAGKDVPLVPRALANLRAAWRMAPRTQLIASARYVGRQRYDNDQANTFPGLMPDYALADLKLSHSVAGWRLSASIDNLFDKFYYLPLGGVDYADWKAGGNPGQIGPLAGMGRSINAGMTMKF